MANQIKEDTSHAKTLMLKIQEMKELNFICDFTIKVGNKSLPTHRLVLAAFSDYFRAMFSNDMKENRQGFVEFKDMDAVAVTKCVEFMYNGKTTLDINGIENILRVADMLQFSEITTYCRKFLEQNLSVESCLHVKEISEVFNFEELNAKCETFLSKNFCRVSQTKKFRELNVATVIKLMENSDGDVKIQWQAALSWIQSTQNKESHFLQILRSLNFDDCTFDYILREVWKNDVVGNSKSCQNIIIGSLVKQYDNQKSFHDFDIGDLCDVLEIAKKYAHEFRKGFVVKLHGTLAHHFEYLIYAPQFLDMNINDIIAIFKYTDIHLQEEVFTATITWINHEHDKRTKYFPRIFETIDLNFLSSTFMFDTVLKEPLVKQCEDFKLSVISYLLSEVDYEDIDLHNWYPYMKISKKHPDLCSLEASEDILGFARNNFPEISSQDKFVRISKEVLYDLLQFQTSCISSKDKWEVVLKWTKHEAGNRRKHLPVLLRMIDFQHLTHNYTKENIFAEKLVKESDECKNIIIEELFAKASGK